MLNLCEYFLSAMSVSSGGLYIHVPFCHKKCLYCDFFSGGTRVARWNDYCKAIINELKERVDELPSSVSSIYFGGGTPSAMPDDRLAALLCDIRSVIGKRLTTDAEITLEANPEDVSDARARAWRDSGFNRLSLGIESFEDNLLSAMGRNHSGVQARKALDTLASYFDNVSADLIFGLPGQSEEQWQRDVRTIISYNPAHISAYCLMFEEGTAFTHLQKTGRLAAPDEMLVLRMFAHLSDALRQAGYLRYEISNYSHPGMHSRHNSLYWTGAPYLGLGPSAHSYDGERKRRANPRDLKGYYSRFASDTVSGVPFYSEERLSDTELMEEFLMLRLRRREGFNPQEFKSQFGAEEWVRIQKRMDRLMKDGLLEYDSGNVRLSEAGIMKSDGVIIDLLL